MSTAPSEPRPDPREALRQRFLDQIPASYNPYLHFAVPSLVGLVCIGFAAATVRDVTAWEALVVPLTWLFSNAAEWRAHKSLLHKRVPGFGIAYDRHTPHHHAIFPEHDMALRSPKEWRFVLLPSWGILMILLTASPIAALLSWLGTWNQAALFVATAAAYVVSYEWLHLAYHLPPDSFVGRIGLVKRLRHHHATHHRPDLMTKWNFNVTLPLWDLVRGTYYRP